MASSENHNNKKRRFGDHPKSNCMNLHSHGRVIFWESRGSPKQYLNNGRVSLYPPICFGLSLNSHCFLPNTLTMHQSFSCITWTTKAQVNFLKKRLFQKRVVESSSKKDVLFGRSELSSGGPEAKALQKPKARLPQRKWYLTLLQKNLGLIQQSLSNLENHHQKKT